MSRRYGRLLAATLAAVLTVGVAGCGDDDKKNEANAASGKIEKVTYITAFGAVGRDALAWVAKDKGYFKDAGFDVDIQLGTGSDANLAKLTGNAAQFGSLDLTAIMINNGNGKFKNVKAIGAFHQQTLVSIMAPQDGTIKSPKDLEGKKVGMATASVNQLLFPAYAKLAGIDPGKVTVQDVPNTGLAAALAANQVDAVSTFLIGQGGIEAGSKKKMNVMPYSDFLRDLYGNAIVVTDDYLKKNKEGTKRMRDALLKALKYTIDHPEEAADIMIKEQKAAVKASAVSEIKLMTPYTTTGSGVFGDINKDKVNKAIAILQGAGLIKADLKAEDSVAFDMVPKA
ncbi:ABC transporter substrate-binding protein [Virgisporangium aurantiacum]|uniref:ABC transporter substrate-binding protein n=2 Tax=Virgisporangium aurantiacum TaxID=175570 RepID=A0A8J4E2W8_9ACTN|nr:ABC transporter substrate-binding protein [Virgisporangium aurantiacum]